jgi:hypothetical protein
MNAYTITAIVLAVLFVVILAFALIKAEDGYQNKLGYHKGKEK